MKTNLIILVLVLVFAIAKLSGQNYFLIEFEGEGAVPEAVLVENLTQGTEVSLSESDILRLKVVEANIQENFVEENNLVIYPNPMDHSCIFHFTNKYRGNVSIQLYSITGELKQNYFRNLSQGEHRFVLSSVPAGMYILSIKTKTEIITGRIVSLGQGGTDFSLVHTNTLSIPEAETNFPELRQSFSNVEKGTKTTVEMNFVLGDKLRFIGYSSGYSNNSIIASPTGNQTYTFKFTSPFYRITGHGITGKRPCLVNILISIKDEKFAPVDNLAYSDFIIKENNELLNPEETYPYLRSIKSIPHSIKTVLMIDNSAGNADNLSAVKHAALYMVNNMWKNQEIAVYSFSDSPQLLQNFTDDVNLLSSAINNISPGPQGRNLFGSFIEGVNAWSDALNEDHIQKGFLVLLTAGNHSFGSGTIQQALNARGQKSTYIIGLGNNVTPDALNQLSNPSPFYEASTVDDLPMIFEDIQNNLYMNISSFYLFNYMTPKRQGNQTCKIEIKNNVNSGSDSFFQSQFSANGFVSATNGVYINPSFTEIYGIDEISVPGYDKFILTAVTYGASNLPVYTWSSEDTDIVTVTYDSQDFNKASLNFSGEIGSTVVTVNDVSNSYSNNITVNVLGTPTVHTNNVSDIHFTTANCGGVVTSEGASPVTEFGICWSTISPPTIDDNKTTDGSGAGSFISSMTELYADSTYYVRAYATNSQGTTYGNMITFKTLGVGSHYQGGRIAYILQPGDIGYIEGQTNGIISSPVDQSVGIDWGCYGTVLGGTSTEIGTGAANTIIIVNSCPSDHAARICDELSLYGYSDWYLPSKDELNKLYINKHAIGNFQNLYYWSSTEVDNNSAWRQNFTDGEQNGYNKGNTIRVRAVRSF